MSKEKGASFGHHPQSQLMMDREAPHIECRGRGLRQATAARNNRKTFTPSSYVRHTGSFNFAIHRNRWDKLQKMSEVKTAKLRQVGDARLKKVDEAMKTAYGQRTSSCYEAVIELQVNAKVKALIERLEEIKVNMEQMKKLLNDIQSTMLANE